MVSVDGFVEAAQYAVGVGTDSIAVEMCSQAIMPNAHTYIYIYTYTYTHTHTNK